MRGFHAILLLCIDGFYCLTGVEIQALEVVQLGAKWASCSHTLKFFEHGSSSLKATQIYKLYLRVYIPKEVL
jgi:hypothetical protein